MKKIGRILLIVIIILLVLATFKFLWDESRPEVTLYDVVSPTQGTVERTVVATGNIEPRSKILIKPQISGIITTINKESGQSIEKNEIIATIKVTTEMSQLNTAESRLKVAEINLNQIKLDFERQKMLFEQEVISRNEFELSEANYKKAVEERDNAQDAWDIARYGVAEKFTQLSNTQARSTISGTILDIPIKEGDYVIQSNAFNPGTTIAAVADMNDLIFIGNVDETEVGLLKDNMPVHIKIGAINNEVFDAAIEYIAPQGKKENGTVLYEIKAALSSSKSVPIRADYSANAEIIIEQSKNVVTIPEGSVEFSNDSAYVYILKSQGKDQQFEKRAVTVGLSDGVSIEVRNGLSLEEKVRGMELD